MKKIIITIAISLAALLFLTFVYFTVQTFFPEVFENYSGWKTVEVKDVGSFQIPNDWNLHKRNGFLYITDKNSNPVMIQTFSDAGYKDDPDYEPGKEEDNGFFKVRVIESLSANALSNGADYGKILVSKNGEESERFTFDMYNETGVLVSVNVSFIVWDESVDEKMVRKIAISFRQSD